MSNYDIGSLSSYDAPYSIDDYYVSTYDSTDVFEFDLFNTSDINLALSPSGGDADLTLYMDNGDGYFDPYTDTFVDGSYLGSTADDSINIADQGAGTYFAQVSYYSSSSSYVDYDLNLSATSGYTASNLLPTETNVGSLDSDLTYYGAVGDSNTSDTYYFNLDFYEGVNITLSGLSSDADIRLVQDFNNNAIVDDYEVQQSSTFGSTTSEFMSTDLSGNYFVQVYQYSGDTNYTLGFDHFTTTYA